MAASKIAICNYALAHLAIGKEIASFTERSKEASVCNRFYDQVRDEALRDFPWPFAKRFADLALVEEEPTYEWQYSYRYPNECLHVRRLLNQASRIETRVIRIPWQVASDTTGSLILTDLQDAQIEFTALNDNPTSYPPDFVQMFALLLASYIAPRIAGGDQFKLGNQALQKYQWALARARQNALNEAQDDLPPPSELEMSRGDGYEVLPNRPLGRFGE